MSADFVQGNWKPPRYFKALCGLGIAAIVITSVIMWFDHIMQETFSMWNQVYQEAVSPDGRTVAILAYRDGPTFGYEYLSLQQNTPVRRPLMRNDDIPDDEVAEMADEGIGEVVWHDNHTLVVKYDKSTPKGDFVKRGTSWRDIKLVWRPELSQ